MSDESNERGTEIGSTICVILANEDGDIPKDPHGSVRVSGVFTKQYSLFGSQLPRDVRSKAAYELS